MSVNVRLPFDSDGKSIAVTRQPGSASHSAELYNSWDFGVSINTKVLAIAPGVVVDIRETVPDGPGGWSTGDKDKSLGSGAVGNLVTIKHVVNGVVFYSTYLHLKQGSVPVEINDTVVAGQEIGVVGNTGVREGTHLHLQVGKTAMQFGSTPYGWDTKTDNGSPQWIADASNTTANKAIVDFQSYGTKLPAYVVGADAPQASVFSSGADKITLTVANQTWSALGGNDTVNGTSGNDTVKGEGGNDKLYGHGGNDYLDGGADNDMLDGGANNDVLDGWTGSDVLLGGTGDDILMGYTGADVLYGGADNDQLYGEADSDILNGGTGFDQLFGGAGSDRFIFSSTADSGATTATADIIGDFAKGSDLIDLGEIDANTTIGGDQKFILDGKGSASSSVARGHIGWYQVNNAGTANDFTYIRINNDSDSSIDSMIRLDGLINLTSSDFIL